MAHQVADLRNLAVLGHGGSGKTALVDAIAFATKVSGRHGNTGDGSSISDTEPEERERKQTLTSHLFHFDHGGKRVCMLDTAGHPDFLADSLGSLRAVETAMIVVDAPTGVTFNTRRLWSEAEKAGVGRIVVLTKPDADNLDFDAVLDGITQSFGDKVVPLILPNGVGGECSAVERVLMGEGASAADYRATLEERVAEADDALMEQYFEAGELSAEQLAEYLPKAIAAGTVVPLLTCAPPKMTGITEMLDFLAEYAPSPTNSPARKAAAEANAEEWPIEVTPDPDGAFAGLVFKVVSDDFVGKMSFVRVVRGTLPADGTFVIARDGSKHKINGLLSMQGKDSENVDKAIPGDVVAIAKLEDLQIGDTVTKEGETIHLRPFEFPSPMVALAVEPMSRGDEQKIGPSLEKLSAEDPTLRIGRDSATGELVVEGLSQLHLDVAFQKLKRRYKVEVSKKEPSVPYQETVMAGADGHHRHKKQSGGRGQFAEVYLRIKAKQRGEGFEFVDKIVGGRIPRQFIPEVEKGIREMSKAGPLAGAPVVDFEIELYDGKFHDVDSDALSFQLAGGRAFRDAFEKAKPMILEPMMNLEIRVHARFTGDITSNLANQRARMSGMDAEGDDQIIRCVMPLKEARGYQTQLRSITAGEGSFTMEFSHYDPVPANIQQEIIAKAKKAED